MEGPAQALISTIDYREYVGRIGVGASPGAGSPRMQAVKTNFDTETSTPRRLSALYP